MKKSLIATLVAGSILGWVSAAAADQEPLVPLPEGKFVGNVTFATQYWFRGLKQTKDGTGAIQGGIEYDHPSGLYLGAWGSNSQVTQSPADTHTATASVEMDFSTGYRNTFAFDDKASFDLGLNYVYYPGTQHADLNFDWLDVIGKVGYDLGFAQPGVKLIYSPDMQYESGSAYYVSADLPVPVGKYFTVTLHGGHQWVDNNARFGLPDYSDYGIGIGANVLGLDVAINYVGNDMKKSQCANMVGGGSCDGIVLTIGKTF
jgi:uncharacterized protein (TIGR02001 family)